MPKSSSDIYKTLPPPVPSQYERELNDDDFARLSADEILALKRNKREITEPYDGLSIESERATHDPQFGYIYRYSIISQISDPFGETHEAHDILALWTKDFESFRIAYYPMMRTPDE